MNRAARQARDPRVVPAARDGFTLVELVIVMGIIAVLIGAGVGLIARLRVADRAAVGIVTSTLRAARNWSVAREAPARVRLDSKNHTLQAFGMSVIGTWHFEGMPVRGAYGTEGLSLGGKIVADGFTGSALSFAGEPARSRVEIPVQLDPAFDLARGFSIASPLDGRTAASCSRSARAPASACPTTARSAPGSRPRSCRRTARIAAARASC